MIRIAHPAQAAGRAAAAALAATTAGIHLHLWLIGYRAIPTIGPLFLLNSVGGGLLAAMLLAIAVATRSRRLAGVVCLAGAGYEAATAVALIVSTIWGLFGFVESTAAPLYWPSLAVEAAAAVLFTALARTAFRPSERPLRHRHDRPQRRILVVR